MKPLAFAILLLSTPPAAGPYVNIYHDDAVAFQVRRDRITVKGDRMYMVWLRWLYAKPQRWGSDLEAARLIIADVDCAKTRVRELGSVHKNPQGKVYYWEDYPEEKWQWRSFERNSGAAATITRLCAFLPELSKGSIK